MHIEAFQHFCEKLQGAEMCFPFDEMHMVFKVGGKMFALAPIEPFERINLKCEPTRALELRAQYPAVTPGFHMNKRHWNSVYMDGSLTRATIYEMIRHSYEQVVAQLPKKKRLLLGL